MGQVYRLDSKNKDQSFGGFCCETGMTIIFCIEFPTSLGRDMGYLLLHTVMMLVVSILPGGFSGGSPPFTFRQEIPT